jgi:hypothetical protein
MNKLPDRFYFECIFHLLTQNCINNVDKLSQPQKTYKVSQTPHPQTLEQKLGSVKRVPAQVFQAKLQKRRQKARH